MSRTTRRSDQQHDLIEALETVGVQLGLIRQVLDGILDEVQWANQNPRDGDHSFGAVRPNRGNPAGTAAPDQVDRLNRCTAADVLAPTEHAAVRVSGAQ